MISSFESNYPQTKTNNESSKPNSQISTASNLEIITPTHATTTKNKKTSKTHKISTAKLSELNFIPSKSNNNTITLEQCLHEYTKLEVLDSGNEWYCSNCKTHQKATKQTKFWKEKLPEILILSLKRFEFRGMSSNDSQMPSRYNAMFGGGGSGGLREKIEDFVDFPLEGLDLSAFCHNLSWTNAPSLSTSVSYDNIISDSMDETSNVNASSSRIKSSTNPGTLYDLFAICNHYGRMGFGHYTAFGRDFIGDQLSSQWYSFDDDLVRACVDANDVKTHAAYMLFYRRRH